MIKDIIFAENLQGKDIVDGRIKVEIRNPEGAVILTYFMEKNRYALNDIGLDKLLDESPTMPWKLRNPQLGLLSTMAFNIFDATLDCGKNIIKLLNFLSELVDNDEENTKEKLKEFLKENKEKIEEDYNVLENRTDLLETIASDIDMNVTYSNLNKDYTFTYSLDLEN